MSISTETLRQAESRASWPYLAVAVLAEVRACSKSPSSRRSENKEKKAANKAIYAAFPACVSVSQAVNSQFGFAGLVASRNDFVFGMVFPNLVTSAL